MTARPNIQARNSSGKQVSLLNDDCTPRAHDSRPSFINPQYSVDHTSMARSHSDASQVSTASSPRTPGLLRSDSSDSQTPNDPTPPITPVFLADYGAQSAYASNGFFKNSAPDYEERHYEYPHPSNQQYSMPVPPSYAESRQASFADSQYEEEGYGEYQNGSERRIKRYPCRFRDSHHCEKTFTTSGHASRHSKIHTAEKAVHCTYQGCQKKFTRADNMKQHLETHYKIKNGSGAASSNSSSSSSSSHKASSSRTLTMPAGISKSTPSQAASRSPSKNPSQAECGPIDPALYAHPAAAHPARTASPSVPYEALDMEGVHSALMSEPIDIAARMRTDSSSAGLDVLANIAALQ